MGQGTGGGCWAAGNGPNPVRKPPGTCTKKATIVHFGGGGPDRGPNAVARGVGRREGGNVGARGRGAIVAHPVGAPRGFGVVGRQARLNLKQFFVNLKSTIRAVRVDQRSVGVGCYPKQRTEHCQDSPIWAAPALFGPTPPGAGCTGTSPFHPAPRPYRCQITAVTARIRWKLHRGPRASGLHRHRGRATRRSNGQVEPVSTHCRGASPPPVPPGAFYSAASPFPRKQLSRLIGKNRLAVLASHTAF